MFGFLRFFKGIKLAFEHHYTNALSGSQAVLGTDSGCFVGANVTAVDLDESRFGMLTAANASTYYAGGSSNHSFSGTINYIMVLGEVLTDTELRTLTDVNLDHDEDAKLPPQPLGANISQMLVASGFVGMDI